MFTDNFKQMMGVRLKAGIVREVADLRRSEFMKTAMLIRAQINLAVAEAVKQNISSVIVQIPPVYENREPYNVVEMGKEVVKQLKEDEYETRGTYVNFTISWAHPKASVPKPVINVPKKTTRKRV